MLKNHPTIYLASQSPRRKKLLKQLGINFKTLSLGLKEEVTSGEYPIQAVKRLALYKSECASKKIKKGILITADTIVVLNKEIIGKPKSKRDAYSILSKLSGKKHLVYTGFVIKNITNKKIIIDYEKTEVTFRTLMPKEINDYIRTGSPIDKAGAYGIQDDFGAVFIKKINGCYYNVIGLPLAKVYNRLKEVF